MVQYEWELIKEPDKKLLLKFIKEKELMNLIKLKTYKDKLIYQLS